MDIPRIFIGFDPREAAAFHVCVQSIIDQTKGLVAIHPLAPNMLKDFDGQRDGSNTFNVARFLIPMLCDYKGWAIFIDGDMVLDVDIAELWSWKNSHEERAVIVVHHDYETNHGRKYLGTPMESANVDYPRKNWSSVVLWNCAHPGNRLLDESYVRETSPKVLHRFQWLVDSDIGSLTEGWNYLVGEQSPTLAHLYHHTLGVPGIAHYADWHGSWKWHRALMHALRCAGGDPVEMVRRAQDRIGDIR